MVPVARKNLLADKVRLLISVGGVTFAVLLILIVQSLYRGFERQAGSFVESVSGNIWVMEQDATDIFHSFSLVPEDAIDKIATVKGVASIIPLYGRRISIDFAGGSSDTYAIAFDVPHGTSVLPDLTAPPPGSIILDSIFARNTGLGVGDAVNLRGRSLTVSQVAPVSNIILSQFSLMSASDARDVLAVPGNVNYLLITVDSGADASAVAATIQRQTSGLRAATKADFAAANRNEITAAFLPVVAVLLIIAFVVGTAVIGLTIYTATIERTREYGVMKAIGASSGYLLRVVLTQSVIVGIAGFALGVPLTFVVNRLAEELVPEFANVVAWRDVVAVFGAALVMSVLATLIPIRRVARIDPAVVFRA